MFPFSKDLLTDQALYIIYIMLIKNVTSGITLMVQWLRLCTSKAGVMGSSPGQGTNIPHATWSSHKKKKMLQ